MDEVGYGSGGRGTFTRSGWLGRMHWPLFGGCCLPAWLLLKHWVASTNWTFSALRSPLYIFYILHPLCARFRTHLTFV